MKRYGFITMTAFMFFFAISGLMKEAAAEEETEERILVGIKGMYGA